MIWAWSSGFGGVGTECEFGFIVGSSYIIIPTVACKIGFRFLQTQDSFQPPLDKGVLDMALANHGEQIAGVPEKDNLHIPECLA